MTKMFYNKLNGLAAIFEDDANILDWPDFQETDTGLAARLMRNTLIAETDLWGLADYPATADQLAYRQALRDITAQSGFPTEVVWPTKPE